MKRTLPTFAIVAALLVVAALVYVRTRGATPAPPPEGKVNVDPPPPETPSTPVPRDQARPQAASRGADGGAPPAGPVTRATGVRLVKGTWGNGPGQFGRKRDPESAPEMPMAILAGAVGEVSILDQVNRRVQRFKDGRPLPPLSFGSDTVQDLVLAPGGRTVLLDRLGADKELQIYGADGKLTNEVPLVGKGVPEGGGVTGVFADDTGIYVERAHGPLVRIADASGNADPERQEILGRPTRDGRLLLAAKIASDSGPGNLVVRAIDRKTGRAAWERPISLGAPILNILLLDSDAKGRIYVAANTGSESPEPPFAIVDETIRAVRLTEEGAPRGLIEIPTVPTADESFRTMAVDEAGNICLMVPREGGLEVMRYSFP